MNSYPRTLLLFIAIAAALSVSAMAQTSGGCCCNLTAGTAEPDSYVPSASACPVTHPDFVFPTAVDLALNKTCSTKCGEVAGLPGIGASQCGSPTFKPPPGNLTASALKGQRVMKLQWNAVCPADAYVVSRCTGVGCTNFQQLAVIGPSTSFTDGSPELRWNTNYTYRMIAQYSIQGNSDPAITSGGTGDIECESQFTTDSFCISVYYYTQFESYLKSYGYAGTSPPTAASAFQADFNGTRDTVFFFKYNKGVHCDLQNKLVIDTSCPSGQLCISQGMTPSCVAPGPCDPASGIFGLAPNPTLCEGTPTAPKYCFIDKSSTNVDKCYPCNQALACYDYKSESSCTKNNCGLGQCEWIPTFPDIGAGVCIDTRYNSCALCNKTGTPGAPTAGAYNAIVDQCSATKAAALSTPQYPCFFSNGVAFDCATATCKVYTPGQCGSPAGGVTLNPDNSIATPSTDPCNIKVCQYDSNPSIQCRKNADGTPATQLWPDCAATDLACERDYFTPLTTLIPIGSPPKFDYLNIRIWEKSNSSDFGHLVLPPAGFGFGTGSPNMSAYAQIPGWLTFFCAYPQNGTPCTTFVSTNATQLNVNDLALQDFQTPLLTMSQGWNVLRYYTKDPAKNVEIVKNFNIFACNNCQGPKVLALNLSPGRNINNVFYVRSATPIGTISYNELSEQVFAGITQGALTTELAKSPASGFNFGYTLTMPSGQSLAEGNGTFAANARDTNGVFMDAPIVSPVVVDTTPPTAMYKPANNSEFTTPTVIVTINFSERVIIDKILLQEFIVYNTSVGPVFAPTYTDVTKLFQGSNNKTFTAQLTPGEGRKIIHVSASDYAGNQLTQGTNSTTFVINNKPPIVALVSPKYGHSSTFTFPLVFATDSVAECRYWSSQTLPPPGAFSSLQSFDSTNAFLHAKTNFNEITKANTPYKVFVQCVDADTGTGSGTFWLTVDPSAPKILAAFAVPNPIVQLPLKTTLKVQTDDPTICRYSNSTSSYDAMEGEFPFFDIMALISHAVNVTVGVPATYTYHVACKNAAGLGPVGKSITFSVDLNQPLKLTSVTPQYWGNTTVPFGVETNKDSFCYYELDGLLQPLGSTNVSSLAHTEMVTLPGAGLHVVPVHCSTGAGVSALGIEEKTINVSVFIDLTPPKMLYVNDTSNNPNFPEFSYFLDRLRIAMNGTDNESGVSRYFYTVLQKDTNAVVKNWTPSVILTGLPWYITGLNLTNLTTYYVRAKAENRASLLSSDASSDGVTVDTSKIPPQCINRELDANETDIDCGGICPPCADFKKCNSSIDCISRICNATKICQPSLCTDLLNGGNETDIDCGGGTCAKCKNNRTCAVHEDCESNYCDAGVCSDNPCFNSMLDGLESDIDCGGACPERCKPGQTCVTTADCETGATCVDGICSVVADEDMDGVPDDQDICPGTPRGEPVDEFGCSASQRYSCNDQIPDAWRIRYFGDVLCDGEYAADGDPDGDGISNYDEFLNGTDPTVSDREPFPWLWLLLILLLMALLGWGGYYYYKHPDLFKQRLKQFQQRFLPRAPPPEKPAPKPAAPHVEDWLSVEELKKLGPQDMSAKSFSQLDSLIRGTLAEHEHPRLLRRFEQEETPLDRLRALALQGMSPKERKELLTKLQLLRKGKLGKAEMEELFRRLRITAAYYEQHKDELEAELQAWTKGELTTRRRKRK